MMRMLAMLLAAVIMLAGCSAGVPLTPEEYKTALTDTWAEWIDSTTGVVLLIPADENAPDFLETVHENSTEAEGYFKTLEACYDDFERIIPPDEYAELHKELLSGVGHERTWLKYLKEMFAAGDIDEFSAASDKLQTHVNRITNNDASLPNAYMKIYLKLKQDGYV